MKHFRPKLERQRRNYTQVSFVLPKVTAKIQYSFFLKMWNTETTILNSVQNSASHTPENVATLATHSTNINPKQTGPYLSESYPLFEGDLSHTTAAAINRMLQLELQVHTG